MAALGGDSIGYQDRMVVEAMDSPWAARIPHILRLIGNTLLPLVRLPMHSQGLTFPRKWMQLRRQHPRKLLKQQHNQAHYKVGGDRGQTHLPQKVENY